MYHGTALIRRTQLYEKVVARASEIEAMERRKKEKESFVEKTPKLKRAANPYSRLLSLTRRVRISEVLRGCQSYYGYTPEEITGRSRDGDLVKARHIAMYVSFRLSGRGYKDIGRMFERDHSTVIHAVKKIHEMYLSEEEDVVRDVDQIRFLVASISVEDQPYWGA